MQQEHLVILDITKISVEAPPVRPRQRINQDLANARSRRLLWLYLIETIIMGIGQVVLDKRE